MYLGGYIQQAPPNLQVTSGSSSSGTLGDGVVFSGNVASGQLGQNHFASGAILAGQLGSGSVRSGNVASGVIGLNHIAQNSIQSGAILSGNIARNHLASGLLQGALQFVIDGGGTALASGYKGDLQIPFNGALTSVTLLSDQTGTARLGLWKDTLANFPTTSGDTITTSGVPLLSGGQKTLYSGTAALSGWITSLAAGDILSFVVHSGLTLTRVTVALQVGVGD